MKLTNRLGLPKAIYNAVAADPYNKGAADFSITELIAPARQRALMLKHKDELEEDVSDRLWSLYGQLMHSMLERAAENSITEKRLFGTFALTSILGNTTSFVVSGAFDTLCLESGTLSDYKFTTSWSFMANKPPKEEWVQQLNMQLELLRMNDMDATSLEIIGCLRDWQLSKFKENKNYPKTQMAKHEIPIWPRDKTQMFIRKRMSEHLKARKILPRCSSEETWGRKRCIDYCSVNNFCTQFKGEDNEPA